MVDTPGTGRPINRTFLTSIRLRYVRHIVQAQISILVLYAATNHSLPIRPLWHLDPLLSISAALSGAVTPIPLLLIGAAILAASLAVGRAFCGWICPLGFVQDLVFLPRRRVRMPEPLRCLKYVILVGGLLTSVLAGWTFLEWMTPMSATSRALASIWKPKNSLTIGLLVFLTAVLFSAATQKRAWCRYLCPVGAILSLPASRKAAGISLNKERCIRCLRCERACSMGIIDIKELGGLRWDSECIMCMECRDACPTDAIGPAFRG